MNSTLLEIHLGNCGLDERHKRPGVELEVVVRGTRQHIADAADDAAGLLHLETDELEDVVRPRLRWRQLGARHRKHLTAFHRPVELDREAASANAPTQNNLRCRAVDEEPGADGKPPFVVASTFNDKRTVEPVRSPDATNFDEIR